MGVDRQEPHYSARQSAKRQKTPDVLTAGEIGAILAEPPNIGLKMWDFGQLVLHVCRLVPANGRGRDCLGVTGVLPEVGGVQRLRGCLNE